VIGVQPFPLNLFKTCLIVLFSGLGLWVLASRATAERMRVALDRFDAQSPKLHRLAAWSLGGLFAAFLSYLRIRQFYELQTRWDMAVETNVTWHMVYGPWFFNSFDDRSHLGQHFSPLFALLGMVYAAVDHPLTLLVVQSLALGLGAAAVFVLGASLAGRPSYGLVLTGLYLCNPYLHSSNAHDVHQATLAVPAVLWLLVGVQSRRPWLAAICALIALSAEESLMLPLAGLGIYSALTRPQWRAFGTILTLGALGYFMLVTRVLLPLFSPEGGLFFWSRYAHLGANLNEAILNLVRDPLWALQEALLRHHQYARLLSLLSTVAFLPLLAWREACLLVIPILTVFLSGMDGQYKLGFHYSAPALPFLFYAAAAGLGRIREWLQGGAAGDDRRRRTALAALCLLIAVNGYRSPGYDVGFTDAGFARAAFDLAALIPPSAAVATDVTFAPLLANRHRICKLGREPGTLCDWTPIGATVSSEQGWASPAKPDWVPEYVLIGAELRPSRQREVETSQAYGRWLTDHLGYRVVESRAGVTLLARTGPGG
jgi:uncharacterized membrane protein